MAENASKKKEEMAGRVQQVTLATPVLESLISRVIDPKLSAEYWPRITHAECVHTSGIPDMRFFIRLVPLTDAQKVLLSQNRAAEKKTETPNAPSPPA